VQSGNDAALRDAVPVRAFTSTTTGSFINAGEDRGGGGGDPPPHPIMIIWRWTGTGVMGGGRRWRWAVGGGVVDVCGGVPHLPFFFFLLPLSPRSDDLIGG
jgi:hypothetical protein